MRQIVLYPQEILRQKTKKVVKVDDQLISDVQELAQVLEASPNGAGLAAVQIGINQRFFGIKNSKTKKSKILINPEIIERMGSKDWIKIKSEKNLAEDKVKDDDFLEGCLSFPEVYGTVKRWLKIKVVWQELIKGRLRKKNKEMIGFEAIVFQHELDHLEGILFIDHIKKDGGKIYRQIGEKIVEIKLEEVER